MNELQGYEEKGRKFLDLLRQMAELEVSQIWIEKCDFDCILVGTDYGTQMHDFEEVLLFPENICALKHDNGMLVKCAQVVSKELTK